MKRHLAVALLSLPLATCATPETAPDCVGLSELQCLQSTSCELVLARGRGEGYACRANTNACEAGFVQYDASKQLCEAKPGCAFEQPKCYCQPGVTCVCGGGNPPGCKPSNQ